MEGLTACTEHNVTGNGHTDGTTTGLTHTDRTSSECYSTLGYREEVGGTVGETTMGG